ncbi:MAG TPA: helix-turn-helix domain-containing protein [Rhizobium sp.]|nr:helix-turn-helix domain-containing protein [Rhizobium sp.]
MEILLTPEQLAEALQVPVSTLYKWRAAGTGPQGIKVGKYIRYRQAAVDAYLAALEPASNVVAIKRRAA